MALLGLLIYLVFLYIRPQDWVPFFLGWHIDFYIFAFVFLTSIINGDFYFKVKNIFFKLFILWIFIILASNIANNNYTDATKWFYTYLRYFIIFTCFFSALTSLTKIKLYIAWTIFLLSILVLQNHSLVQTGIGWANQGLGWGTEPRARWVGLWNGMGSYALIFVAAIPFVLWQAVYSKTLLNKLFFLVITIWLFYGGYLTRARGALIAFLGIAALFVIDYFRNFKSIFLIALLLGLFFFAAPGRLTDFDDQSNSASNRINVWDDAYTMLRYWPVIGIGRGQYSNFTYTIIAHNSFLEIAGETGFLGLFVWLSILYLSLKGLMKSLRVCSESMIPIIKGTIYSLIGYQFSSFFVTTEFELMYIYIALAATISSTYAKNLRYTLNDMRNVLFIEIIGLLFFRVVILLYWKIYN